MNRPKKLSAAPVIGVVVLSLLSGIRPAGAQYANPYTGRTFNNPMSSYLGSRVFVLVICRGLNVTSTTDLF